MKTINKKAQITKAYLDEILPYLEYNEVDEKMRITAQLKFGSLSNLDCDKLSKHINVSKKDDFHLILDFKDSSIHDIYNGLTLLSNAILKQ